MITIHALISRARAAIGRATQLRDAVLPCAKRIRNFSQPQPLGGCEYIVHIPTLTPHYTASFAHFVTLPTQAVLAPTMTLPPSQLSHPRQATRGWNSSLTGSVVGLLRTTHCKAKDHQPSCSSNLLWSSRIRLASGEVRGAALTGCDTTAGATANTTDTTAATTVAHKVAIPKIGVASRTVTLLCFDPTKRFISSPRISSHLRTTVLTGGRSARKRVCGPYTSEDPCQLSRSNSGKNAEMSHARDVTLCSVDHGQLQYGPWAGERWETDLRGG